MEHESTIHAAVNFVKSLISPETHLCWMDENNASGSVRSNALATMVLVHEHEISLAEQIFRVFNRYYHNTHNRFDGFPHEWNARTGLPERSSIVWDEDTAILFLALNYYQQKRGHLTPYTAMANEMISALIKKAAGCDLLPADVIASLYAALSHCPDRPGITTYLQRLRDCFFSHDRICSADFSQALNHFIRGVKVFGITSGCKYIRHFMKHIPQGGDILGTRGVSNFIDDDFIDIALTVETMSIANMLRVPDAELTTVMTRDIGKWWLPGRQSHTAGLPARIDRTTTELVPALEPTCHWLFYRWNFNYLAPCRKVSDA